MIQKERLREGLGKAPDLGKLLRSPRFQDRRVLSSPGAEVLVAKAALEENVLNLGYDLPDFDIPQPPRSTNYLTEGGEVVIYHKGGELAVMDAVGEDNADGNGILLVSLMLQRRYHGPESIRDIISSQHLRELGESVAAYFGAGTPWRHAVVVYPNHVNKGSDGNFHDVQQARFEEQGGILVPWYHNRGHYLDALRDAVTIPVPIPSVRDSQRHTA